MRGRATRNALGAVLVAISLTGCMSDARREIEAERAKAHVEPLELNGPKGQPVARIGTDGSLFMGYKPVAIDARQRAATLAYREAALKVIDASLIGAEEDVHFAVPRFLFDAALHMSTDVGAEGAEKNAEKIIHSSAFCDALEGMWKKQEAMVIEVPLLRPYAHVTAADIQDCRAGRPYQHSI